MKFSFTITTLNIITYIIHYILRALHRNTFSFIIILNNISLRYENYWKQRRMLPSRRSWKQGRSEVNICANFNWWKCGNYCRLVERVTMTRRQE